MRCCDFLKVGSLSILCTLAWSLGGPAVHAEPLTLRLDDAVGPPGGRVAVVLRTYAPRPIRQGQLCFLVRPAPAGLAESAPAAGPFAALEEVVVFSQSGDAESHGVFPGDGSGMVMVEFSSPSGGVNRSDGPLGALFLRLAEGLDPGAEYVLEIDPGQTWLVGEDGQSVPLELRGATLTIRSPTAPHDLEAEGDRVPPGTPAVLGVATAEPFAIAGGQVALRYPQHLLPGPPVVRVDPRYGRAELTVDSSVPGLVRVGLDSADASLGWLPGHFLFIALPTSPVAPHGSRGAVWIDPELTWLTSPEGAPLPLRLEADELEIEALDRAFADGFESGGTGAWSVISGSGVI